MSVVWPILAMGAGVYALRLAGLVLRDVTVPPAWERALGFVPVALLTALVVSSLAGRADDGVARLLAAVGAGLVARRTGRMWACILSGMALYWLLRRA
ncbi:MAG: AzlD domain-containing protein [Chloroflexota bacterium]|nr:AzlD domain-containing protein [Chloroflexota bacterium]